MRLYCTLLELEKSSINLYKAKRTLFARPTWHGLGGVGRPCIQNYWLIWGWRQIEVSKASLLLTNILKIYSGSNTPLWDEHVSRWITLCQFRLFSLYVAQPSAQRLRTVSIMSAILWQYLEATTWSSFFLLWLLALSKVANFQCEVPRLVKY